MGQDSDDRRRTSSAGRIWQDHKDMVTQALRVSIPWFTFVNISFALIILFRHILISDFDKSISAQTGILPLIDDIMGSIIVFFVPDTPFHLPPSGQIYSSLSGDAADSQSDVELL